MERRGSDILDEMLVLSAQAGDRVAITTLVERWHPTLLRHASYMLGDRQRGADAAQEAWVSIIRKIGGLHDPDRFGAWSLRIVTNKCRDAARKARRSGEVADVEVDRFEAPATAGSGSGDETEVHRLRAALRRLPGEQRALLALRYVDRLTVPRIAGVLGVAEGTVKSRLHSARAELKTILEQSDERDSDA